MMSFIIVISSKKYSVKTCRGRVGVILDGCMSGFDFKA